jgi:hypothetical protein
LREEKKMNLDELNYPIPDPTWDYATIYHRCHHARQELESQSRNSG